jgi:CPA2 family monovalent cation:H+ antiporter-2
MAPRLTGNADNLPVLRWLPFATMLWNLASSAGQFDGLLKDLLIILAAAGVVAVAMHRLRLAIIPAYLLTGALIGPGGLGFVNSAERVQTIADLAIILLLFGIGLHMDVSVLRSSMTRLLLSGASAIVLCTLAIWPLALLLGVSAPSALTIAIALAMSSTAVVLRIIQDRRQLSQPDGRLSFAILIFQDLASVVALLMLPPLARWNGRAHFSEASAAMGTSLPQSQHFLLSGVLAVSSIAFIILAGRYILPRLLFEAARQKSSESMTVVSIAAALGAAGLTQMVGLSPALGAYLGGFLLSSTPFRHQLAGQVATIRDLFSAVFFTAIGMSLGLDIVFTSLPVVIIGALLLLVVKTIMIGLSCWLSGNSGNLSIKVGLMLAQAGEFSIVVLSAAALVAGEGPALVDSKTMGIVISMIVLTLIATPAVINGAMALDARLKPIPAPPWGPQSRRAEGAAQAGAAAAGEPSLRRRSVIVAGFGLVGRVVADNLTMNGAQVTIVEMNPATVKTQTRLGRNIVFGDVSDSEVLESAGVHEADALILTIPDEERVLRACHVARQANHSIFIVARTSYVSKGMLATNLGANEVVIEELATAEAMERMIARILPPALAKSDAS